MRNPGFLFPRLCTFLMALFAGTVLFSFRSEKKKVAESIPASFYTPAVLDKWLSMQIKLMSTTVASFNGPFVRIYAYSGLAAYESIVPGIPANSFNLLPVTVFNGMPPMPETEPGKNYHWPSSMNTALAFMNRAMFPSMSPDNKAAIDSLERSLNTIFSKEADSLTIERSVAYGKKVAQKIFDWAEMDGYRHASNPYTPPAGPGKWVPTPPNYARAVTPYYGRLRTIVTGSTDHTDPVPPPEYSEEETSPFYKMIKEVYDVDRQITSEQKAIVSFWRDINPGFTAPGHWLNILRLVFQKEKEYIRLDKAAFAYALSGMALNDAWITCWKTRYEYNLVRPVTFIRNNMGHRDWLPLLLTPPHPEYTSGFAAMAGAVCASLSYLFGSNYQITDHTYDQFGMAPRSFSSFDAMAREAGLSKFYGGIHYKLSVDEGLKQGKAVAKNIQALLQKAKSASP
jgi:hypothetical protein